MIKTTVNVNQSSFIVGCIDGATSNNDIASLSSQFNEIMRKPPSEEKVRNILQVYLEEIEGD
jgi:hypothetical protein